MCYFRSGSTIRRKQATYFACVAVEEAEGPCACVNLKIRDRQTLVRHLYKTGPPPPFLPVFCLLTFHSTFASLCLQAVLLLLSPPPIGVLPIYKGSKVIPFLCAQALIASFLQKSLFWHRRGSHISTSPPSTAASTPAVPGL